MAQFDCFSDLPFELRSKVWEFALPGPRIVKVLHRPLDRTIGDWETETKQQWPLLREHLEDVNREKKEVNFRHPGQEEDDDIQAMVRDEIEDELRMLPGHRQSTYRDRHLIQIFSRAPISPLASVCHEARIVFLMHYTPILHSMGSFPQTYFDFSVDTLYINHEDTSYYYRDNGRASIPLEIAYRFCMEDTNNLGRVERLALLMDEDYLANDYTMSREEFLGNALRAFGGIQELSLVVRDFMEIDNKGNPLVVDNLLLLDADAHCVDIAEALETFRGFNIDAMLERQISVGAKPHIPDELGVSELDTTWARPDMPDLERIRQKDCQSRAGGWKMPEISIKSVATAEQLEELSKVMAAARAELLRGFEDGVLDEIATAYMTGGA